MLIAHSKMYVWHCLPLQNIKQVMMKIPKVQVISYHYKKMKYECREMQFLPNKNILNFDFSIICFSL